MSEEVKKEDVTETVAEAVEAVEEAKEEVKEAVEAVKEAKEAVAEVKEEAKAEEKPAKAEPSGKFASLIKEIESLSVIELADLVKTLEDRFGVSAAAPVAVAGAAPAGAAAAQEEEKSAYNVVLTSAGSNKIGVIKAIREILPDLGLKEAKDMAEGAPVTVKENMKKEEAEVAKEKLTAAGATVELQ
jgi:large subunit ribosomal protein L7/L12